MSSMFNLTYIFQFIVNRFNYSSFTKVYFVLQRYFTTFHIGSANLDNQMNAINKKNILSVWEIYPLSAYNLPNTDFINESELSGSRSSTLSPLSYDKTKNFTFVINDYM